MLSAVHLGLLDVTDNMVDGVVVHPPRVRRYDGDDPYLVVAADKGTATFSDLANEVAAAYGFWLGDAFASGGSNGYDHKKMAITARGAWICVQRHFNELGHRRADRTRSRCSASATCRVTCSATDCFARRAVRLVAAFNHQHVFIDPEPGRAAQFRRTRAAVRAAALGMERLRPALISKGGGVFARSQKAVADHAADARAVRLRIDARSPDELIHLLS